MPLNRRHISVGLLAGAATLAAQTSFAAGRPITVSSLFGDDKPETRIWLKIREILNAKAPGRFDFRIVGNAALGGEKEVAEGIKLGSVQASLSTISALSSWVPESQILDLPFVFRDRNHLKRVLGGPLGDELKAKFEAQGFIVLSFINYGARHLLAKEAIVTPAQLAGKRIRVIQSPLHTELWSGLGAFPTPIPIPETYNALKTGVVDCMDLTKSAMSDSNCTRSCPTSLKPAISGPPASSMSARRSGAACRPRTRRRSLRPRRKAPIISIN